MSLLGTDRPRNLNRPIAARIGEAHLTPDVKSDDRIATEYNNQNAPLTFVTKGTQA